MKILLATDGSESSLQALHYLKDLRCQNAISVTVFTAIAYPQPILGDVATDWIPDYLLHQHDVAREHQTQCLTSLHEAGLIAESVVEDGDPGTRIVEKADELGVDLVVVGAKGHSAIDRILLGSVSDYVATHCNCSVLVHRTVSESGTDANAAPILISVDGTEASDMAVRHFSQFNWPETVVGSVFCVVPVVRTFRRDLFPSAMAQAAQRRDAARRETQRVALRLENCFGELQTDVVESDHVGDAIVNQADKLNANVLVLGDSGRGMVGRLLLGSESRYVLHHAECSVWIGRDREVAVT
ncbi:MAG: universal stress protein [Planctomycetota bacterium]